jgi:hypothetical protein
MSRGLVTALLAVLGLLCAAGMGFAAYYVSRDSVATPVTQLQPKPQLAPSGRAAEKRAAPKRTVPPRTTSTRAAVPPPPPPPVTVDDHGGRDDNSGRGGGHGSDD